MESKALFLVALAIGCAAAQNYKVCISANSPTVCQSLETGNSQVACRSVRTRIDCALQLLRGDADVGYFSEEEVVLLAQLQPSERRVVAEVRDVNRMEPYAFEAVAVVAGTHSGGLAGLRGGAYCHPGLDETDQRWSPRVRKALELAAAQTDRCSGLEAKGKAVDQLEMETLSSFFSAACRPGAWSANLTLDAQLKSQYPSMCSLCGGNSCAGYSLDMGVTVAGVRNENRHIQALECLRVNSRGTTPAVAYVAWQHAREYFTIRNPQDASQFSVLCPDGTLQALTQTVNNATAPCAFVRQPWAAILASTSSAASVLSSLRAWWPTGADPGAGAGWQSVLFGALAGGANARVVFQTAPVSLDNYTTPIRPLASIDSAVSCTPALRWCVVSAAELAKCWWVRGAAYTLGLQPPIACARRADVPDCLKAIGDGSMDFIAASSNYGYLARQHYKLSPVKLVQNPRAAAARVAALVKASAANNLTRFESLRGTRACFPEFGGLSYMSFVRAGQEAGVLARSECDYARAVGEFFSAACAPGAADATHALSSTTYDPTNLCSVCESVNSSSAGNTNDTFCAWHGGNRFFGNRGALACLAEPANDVAFLNVNNIDAYLSFLNLPASQFRVLCRNNTLAAAGGGADDACALALVVDAEILTRRGEPAAGSLSVLLDALDAHFGYTAAGAAQLVNLEIFSPFDGISNQLFKDSAIGLTEPSASSSHEPAKNYMELLQHLDKCTSAAGAGAGGGAGGLALLLLAAVLVY